MLIFAFDENVSTKITKTNFDFDDAWYTCNLNRLTIALLTTYEQKKRLFDGLSSFAELFVTTSCVWEKLAERWGLKSFPFVNTYFKFWNYKQTFRIINWKIAWICWFRTFAHWVVDADVVVVAAVVVNLFYYHRNTNNTMYYYFLIIN